MGGPALQGLVLLHSRSAALLRLVQPYREEHSTLIPSITAVPFWGAAATTDALPHSCTLPSGPATPEQGKRPREGEKREGGTQGATSAHTHLISCLLSFLPGRNLMSKPQVIVGWVGWEKKPQVPKMKDGGGVLGPVLSLSKLDLCLCPLPQS